jgi:sigma-B regulation protein RsbU (phosphoserine phosphatase)
MAVNIIGAIVLLLVLFGVIVSAIGFVSFTNAFKKEYAVSTYHMADTATTLINGDHLEAYLAGEEAEEYQQTRAYLNAYCKKMSVSLIYVILVDRTDYGRFVSVFNSVNNSVDDTSYTEWELGHKRDTTNDEYRRKYRALYEQTTAYETVYRFKTSDGQHPHITTMVPVKNSAGAVTAILCMQRPARELQDARRPYLRSIAASTVLLALLASAFAVVFLRSHIIGPIRKVSDEATRFAKENTRAGTLGEISRYEEIARLAGSIDTMETDMVNYVENLTAVTAEKERISTELSLAKTIQENSLPNIFPPFPERSEFDIYASMDPAREVGGDFYNFFLIDDDHLAMAIGDVSGKGVPAALFMMVTNILASNRAQMGGSPSEVLTYVNRRLCEHNKAEMFVTLWLGILHIPTGRIIASNAGHEYPAVCHEGKFEILKDKHGFVAGGLGSARYTDYEIFMKPGDRLFVYTDGVPEATNASNELFGTDRMLSVLNGEPDACPEKILQNMRNAVDGFVAGAEQFDDLTMLCIQYKGRDPEKNED